MTNTAPMLARLIGIASLALAGVSTQVEATILTFDDLAERQFVPNDYGDRVSAANTNGYSYGRGEGFTPNVIVEFQPRSATQPQYNAWTGYAGLNRALGHNSFNVPGEIRLLPDPGITVVLHSFDIGVWQANYPGSRIQVFAIDKPDALFDTGVIELLLTPDGPGGQIDNYEYAFRNGLSSTTGLRIVIEDLGDLAIDNLSFSQTPIPVPAALPLFACGLAGLAAVRRRRV